MAVEAIGEILVFLAGRVDVCVGVIGNITLLHIGNLTRREFLIG